MNYDHDAIMKAYSNVTRIADDEGVFDKEGEPVIIVQSVVDEARATLNAEAAASKYKRDRSGRTKGVNDTIYLPIGDQLDLLYKDIINRTLTENGDFAKAIKATKDKYPKPS